MSRCADTFVALVRSCGDFCSLTLGLGLAFGLVVGVATLTHGPHYETRLGF